MATVDGITAAKAQEIEDASVVAGAINPSNGHLILTTAGGTDIDAGLVKDDSALITHEADTSTHGVGLIVGATETQTLSGKTLVTPTIASFLNAQHNHSNAAGGGSISPQSHSHSVNVLTGTSLVSNNITTGWTPGATAFSATFSVVSGVTYQVIFMFRYTSGTASTLARVSLDWNVVSIGTIDGITHYFGTDSVGANDTATCIAFWTPNASGSREVRLNGTYQSGTATWQPGGFIARAIPISPIS